MPDAPAMTPCKDGHRLHGLRMVSAVRLAVAAGVLLSSLPGVPSGASFLTSLGLSFAT